jgi:hypothetical protein
LARRRTRIAASAAVATAILLALPGLAFAVDGPAEPGGDAAQAVYPDPGDGDILGERGEGGGGSDEPADLQSTEQLAATGSDSSDLPFTGLMVIPLLLIGALALGVGAGLRRRGERS